MPRQSISLTDPNAEWLKSQIDNKEFTSVTDVINDLIRQARRKEEERLDKIRDLLIEAEDSVKTRGYSSSKPGDIRKKVLHRKGLDGNL